MAGVGGTIFRAIVRWARVAPSPSKLCVQRIGFTIQRNRNSILHEIELNRTICHGKSS
jgi:hypothetical protein